MKFAAPNGAFYFFRYHDGETARCSPFLFLWPTISGRSVKRLPVHRVFVYPVKFCLEQWEFLSDIKLTQMNMDLVRVKVAVHVKLVLRRLLISEICPPILATLLG